MKIQKTKDNYIITIEVLIKQKIRDYFGEEVVGEMDNIVGVIDKKNDEYGLAFLIDRSHKGKSPDITSTFVNFDGNEKDFKKLCQENGIQIYEINN